MESNPWRSSFKKPEARRELGRDDSTALGHTNSPVQIPRFERIVDDAHVHVHQEDIHLVSTSYTYKLR
jgi:hypothetical protein